MKLRYKHKIVLNYLESFGGECEFHTLLDYINDIDSYGMSHKELRGVAMALPNVELKDSVLRLI